MYFAFSAALLVEEAVRVVRGERLIRPFQVAALLLLAYLCSVYYLVFGGLAFALIVMAGLPGPTSVRPALLRLALTGGLVAVSLLPFLLPRLALDQAERAAGGQPELKTSFRAGADVLSILAQPRNSTIDLPGSESLRDHFGYRSIHESTIFPGVLLLGGLAGLVVLRSGLRRPLLLAALTLWLLALGPSLKIADNHLFTYANSKPVAWLPYAALQKAPGLSSLRGANRASFTLAAVLTVALSLSLTWLFDRARRPSQRAAVNLGCGILLTTSLIIPLPRETLEVTPATERGLQAVADRSRRNESLLTVPADCYGVTLQSIKLQILHQSPAIGCQSSLPSLPWYSELGLYANSEELAALRCEQDSILRRRTRFRGEQTFEPRDMSALAEELDVRFLLVDRRLLEVQSRRGRCEKVKAAIPHFYRYELLARDSRWLVFDVQPR